MAEVAVEAAPGDENDDNWLYGESTGELIEGKTDEVSEKEPEKPTATEATTEDKEQEEGDVNNDDSEFNDEHFAEVGREDQEQNGDADSQENGDSDSDDSDDVKVTIGEIKSGPQYASLNIKRGVGLVAPGAAEKPRSGAAGGKVTLEDLDGQGSINGVPAMEFNIDTIEDKPWNKPGADISDYFNYGFNEVTWSAYCERQRRMRVNEAGVGLHVGPPLRPPAPELRRPTGPVRNDDGMNSAASNNYQARENTIQVMTAERREYGRSHARDAALTEYFGAPPQDYYPPAHHSYDEPWGHSEQTGWAPTEIKELTPGPMGPPMGPPVGMQPPHMPPHMMAAPPFASPYRPHAPHAPHPPHPPHAPHAPHHERERDRERDRDSRLRERDDRDRRDRDRRDDQEERDRDRERDRSRSIKPDRIREKSYRRERSRSRSRRHKSRSRSPRQRERSRERENERTRERDRSRERERSRDRERSVKPKTKDKEKDDDK